VQCIYFDPPYGIKFNSNFQWSTTSRDVKDGKADHITREPEQVKAFRDTWRDGIHSYLTYLRDRLTVARDLLTDSGSIFVQILEPLREKAERRAQEDLAGVGDSARGRQGMAGRHEEAARRLVAGAHRSAEGNRRLHRRQGRV
jgi:hypothetical protein